MPSSWQNEPRSIALGLRKHKDQQKQGPHKAFLQKETVWPERKLIVCTPTGEPILPAISYCQAVGKERSERVDKNSIRAPIRPRAAATPTTVAAQVVADHGSPGNPVAVVIKAF